jgi:hypothetical protein
MSTLKLEVGKTYRTFDGRKAVCLTTTLDGKFRIGLQVGGRLIEITGDGNYIASEWIDKPIIDWSLMPAWAKFVVMEKNGKWYIHTSEPLIDEEFYYWRAKSDSICSLIPTEYCPKWEGDWKKSLIERP